MPRAIRTLCKWLALALLPLAASADYPIKAVKLIVPYGLGGAADLAAHTLASTAPTYLGQSLIVINRSGAAGVTGSSYIAHSKPDGYALLLARVGSQVSVPALNSSTPYRWDDFTFLGLLELNPFVLVVNRDGAFHSFADLENALKSGQRVSYSSAGVGTLLHIAMAVFVDELGADFASLSHAPYAGGGAAAAAVVNGQVELSFQNLSAVIGAIKSNRLRALAVTTKQRFAAIPDVPTVRELGHPELEAIIGWSGLSAPKALPAEIVDKWVAVLQQLKQDKSWHQMTEKLGSIPAIGTPAEMEGFAKIQFTKFRKIVKKLGIAIR